MRSSITSQSSLDTTASPRHVQDGLYEHLSSSSSSNKKLGESTPQESPFMLPQVSLVYPDGMLSAVTETWAC